MQRWNLPWDLFHTTMFPNKPLAHSFNSSLTALTWSSQKLTLLFYATVWMRSSLYLILLTRSAHTLKIKLNKCFLNTSLIAQSVEKWTSISMWGLNTQLRHSLASPVVAATHKEQVSYKNVACDWMGWVKETDSEQYN